MVKLRATLPQRPRIVCLCGSARFVSEFNSERRRLTEAGQIVLAIEVVTTQDRAPDPQHADPALKARLDELHLHKIELADYCRIVSDESGYFGDSTVREIAHAIRHGKPVEFMHPEAETRWKALEASRD